MTCPLCSKRPAKRRCPALEREICPTCCATKRLVEIRCPSDCSFLETAHRHPAAVVRRQQEQDLTTLMAAMDVRLSEMQLQLFFLLASLIVRYKPEGFVRLTDADVADSAGAMATTLEAADRGIIAEVPGASPVGESLRRQLDGLLAELGKGAGSGFGREAAMVLRGIERGARHQSPGIDPSESGYLDVLRRLLPPPAEERSERPPSPILIP